MKFPNKITTYNESSFPKMILIMKALEAGDASPLLLYEKLKNKLDSYKEYLELLTCLYALNKVKLTELEELHLC